MFPDVTVNSTREDFLAFLRAKLNTFIEPATPAYEFSRERKRVSSDLRIEVESHQLSQASEALAEAEKLSKSNAYTVPETFDQENEKISEEISKALPISLISTLIQSYYEDRFALLIQIGIMQKRGAQRTVILALCVFMLSLLFFIGEGFVPLRAYQMLLLGGGLVCSGAGLMLLGINTLQRKKANKTVEKQELFNKLKVAQTLLDQVTNEDLKDETLHNLFVAMLTRNNRMR